MSAQIDAGTIVTFDLPNIKNKLGVVYRIERPDSEEPHYKILSLTEEENYVVEYSVTKIKPIHDFTQIAKHREFKKLELFLFESYYNDKECDCIS